MGKGDRMNLYNTSHCLDKTAAEAIQKADRGGYRDKRAMEFISMVHRLAKMAGYKYYTCSLCCKGSAIKSNYCPNCGARMDGENEMD